MQIGRNSLLVVGAFVALGVLALTAVALEASAEPPPTLEGGEDSWVPSLAITGGANFQNMDGIANSLLFEGMVGLPPTVVPLQGLASGDDLVVAPFVGASLELMSPALPIPTRPRFFAAGEILPSFASKRNVVLSGDPGCIRGPEADAPCAVDETGTTRAFGFGEDFANGQGTRLTAEIQTLVYGASMGVSFPFNLGGRRLRIKPYAAWLSYEVESTGLVSNADCLPVGPVATQCTTTTRVIPLPPPNPPIVRTFPGFLRQPEALTASDSRRFHGIGPGLDIEVDTGRFGPIGTSLFMGARAYNILGDRSITYGTAVTYPSPVPNFAAPPPDFVPDPICSTPPRSCPDSAEASFKLDVDSWMFRAHVGIRFQWLAGWR